MVPLDQPLAHPHFLLVVELHVVAEFDVVVELVLVAEHHPHSPPHPHPKVVLEAGQVDLGSMLVGWSEVVVWNRLLAFS
jgi:hypothetical protein